MLEHALTFLVVARHGSFQEAGRVLGVATSTVSRRVDQLEEHLGARLVDRGPRGLTLTEPGRRFATEAAPIAESLADAEDAVRSWMTRPAGRLRVVAPSGFVASVVSDVALAYLRAFPDVSLEVVGSNEDVVPDGDAVHVVVRASIRPMPESVVQQRVAAIPMCLCAAPSWLESNPVPVEPEDLTRVGCVVLGGDPEARRIRVSRGEETRELTVPIALFTTSVAMARRAGIEGVGPVGLPAAACADALADGALMPILPAWSLASVPVVVATSGRVAPLRVRAFVDRLVEGFAKVEY